MCIVIGSIETDISNQNFGLFSTLSEVFLNTDHYVLSANEQTNKQTNKQTKKQTKVTCYQTNLKI